VPAAGARSGFHLNDFIRKLYYDCNICPRKEKTFPESVKIIVRVSSRLIRAGWLSEAGTLSHSTKQSDIKISALTCGEMQRVRYHITLHQNVM